MRSGRALRFIILGLILSATSSCAGFSYNSTGRAWVVRPGETIRSDSIRARRAVTFQASGRLEAGAVTVAVYRDGVMAGPPVAIRAGRIDERTEYVHEEGLWSFSAEADGEARGELFLSIGDR